MRHVTSPLRGPRGHWGRMQLHCGGPGMTWERPPLEWAPQFQRNRGHSFQEGRGQEAGFIYLQQG